VKPRIYTKKGDDGTTGLLFGGLVRKDSWRIELNGAVDEAQAAIGLARAELEPGSEAHDRCQEYILKSDRLIYRIRPKDEKHPTLLPVGESAEFRLHKDKMLLRVPESDGKEREYIVVSMTPRADASDTQAARVMHQ